ncbi:MAG: methyltransferase domain-containing protein, partial [Burkholderiaceae bacterium]
MQHLSSSAQLAIKQRVLEDQFQHIAGMRPEHILRPIAGPDWHYRYRARLAVRDVFKKGTVLVGFHEKGSGYVADMTECHVLPPQMSALLMPLRELIGSLAMRRRVPQIEMAIGIRAGTRAGTRAPESPLGGAPGTATNNSATARNHDDAKALHIALVFRVLDTPCAADRQCFEAFGKQHRVQIWFQSKGPETIEPLDPEDSELFYPLPEYGLQMPFRPTDFTQVNHHINASLISQALGLLQPGAGERIGDLFCGLGNFSLPIARSGARVLGLEGSKSLCERATQAARVNGLTENIAFATRNLFDMTPAGWTALEKFDGLLIDPPREGAAAVVESIRDTGQAPARIVYVSCNPATLARDTATLVQADYRLRAAGVVNMFPHTSHVESIAHFVHRTAA